MLVRPCADRAAGSREQDRFGHHRQVMRALLLENVHPVAAQVLEAAGIEVVTRPGALDEPELIEELAEGVHDGQ